MIATKAPPLRSAPARLAMAGLLFLLVVGGIPQAANGAPAPPSPTLALWDTGTRVGDSAAAVPRSKWRRVPSNLLALEADPPKAGSDPGYYGRRYAFEGDAVVENRKLVALFRPGQSGVTLFLKTGSDPDVGAAGAGGFGNRIVEVMSRPDGGAAAKLDHCEIVRNAGDEIVLEAFYSAAGSAGTSAVLTFDTTDIVGITPSARLKTLDLVSPIDFGVVPTFLGDDLLFSADDDTETPLLHLPAEHAFLGLLHGEGMELMMTWPEGGQRLRLRSAKASADGHRFEAVEFDADGRSVYLAPLASPGIWHREVLKPNYLERDVAIGWKRPYPARWKTQFEEAGVPTTFAFKDAKAQIWRGVPGSYNYPAWFQGDGAMFHLSKKVPPRGLSLIYCLEGQDSPAGVVTPVDVLKETLGRTLTDQICDVAGRRLRTHHRRGADGVRRACTCGCTEAIQDIFEAGQEVSRKSDIAGALEDMQYFVDRHVERIGEYRQFAADTIQYLRGQRVASPGLKPFLDVLEPIVQEIPESCDVQKENMKSRAYADELTQKTLALTERQDHGNLEAYMELLKLWRGMGGAQDYVVANCHAIARKLFQQAGYRAVESAEAVDVATEVRARCRKILRNPDGYEIWADY